MTPRTLKTGGTTQQQDDVRVLCFCGGLLLCLAIGFAAARLEKWYYASHSEMATITTVDHLNSFTVFRLHDGKLVRKEGRYGEVGDKVPLEIYVRFREPK